MWDTGGIVEKKKQNFIRAVFAKSNAIKFLE